MPLVLVGSENTSPEPRCIVLRALSDLDAALAIANTAIPVLVVVRLHGEERQRVADVLTGWAIGADATLDWIGAHTVALRTPGAAPALLRSHGLAKAVERAI